MGMGKGDEGAVRALIGGWMDGWTGSGERESIKLEYGRWMIAGMAIWG